MFTAGQSIGSTAHRLTHRSEYSLQADPATKPTRDPMPNHEHHSLNCYGEKCVGRSIQLESQAAAYMTHSGKQTANEPSKSPGIKRKTGNKRFQITRRRYQLPFAAWSRTLF